MSPVSSVLSSFELAGLLTHVAVSPIGAGGSVDIVALPRGRRSGLGLVLMALSMVVLVVQPRWQLGPDLVVAAGHVAFFAIALWLLIGPVRPVGLPHRL